MNNEHYEVKQTNGVDLIKVLFLDIDGVIQPLSKGMSGDRFKYDLKELVKDLTKEYKVDYSFYNEYDVGACYLDWDKDAVERIRTILEKTGAKIVISSDWQSKRETCKMKNLLRLYGLDKYYEGQTEDYIIKRDDYECIDIDAQVKEEYKDFDYREKVILNYLDYRKDIISYVVIDDMNLKNLGDCFVKTRELITDLEMEKAIEILNKDKK